MNEKEIRQLLFDYHNFYLKWRMSVDNSSPEYCIDAFLEMLNKKKKEEQKCM